MPSRSHGLRSPAARAARPTPPAAPPRADAGARSGTEEVTAEDFIAAHGREAWERWCAEDDAAFAVEAALRATFTLEPDPDIIGRRFGALVVIDATTIRRPTYRRPGWIVLCDCGRRIVVRNDDLMSGRAERCHACANRAISARRWRRVQGRTLLDIARAGGLPVKTVASRYERGAPVHSLGSPTKHTRRAA